MFNKRWKKVLAWSLSVVIVLAIGGVFAANYAIDKLMTSMAEGIELESDNNSASENALEALPTLTALPTITAIPMEKAVSDITTNENVKSNVNAPTETVLPTNTPQTVKEPKQPTAEIAPHPTKSPAVEGNGDLEEYTAQVSADKAKNIQENVTVKEKADVASIVMGQLSMSDIKRLQELASGGLTLEEKREARQILLDKVSSDQYNELSQIAKKYGVSRGLTHDQVVAEEQQMEAIEEGSEQQ